MTELLVLAVMCFVIGGFFWMMRNGNLWVAEDRILAYLKSGPKDIEQIRVLMGDSGTHFVMEAIEKLVKKNKIRYSDLDDKYPCVMIELK